MKSLIFIAVLIAAVTADQSVTDLLGKLDDLLVQAYENDSSKGIQAVNTAKDVLFMSYSELKKANTPEKIKEYQSYIDQVAEGMPDIERLVRGEEIKSRSLADKLSFVSTKANLLVSKVNDAFGNLKSSGLGGLVSIFEPFIEKILANPEIKNAVGGLEVVKQALESLNKMTNGSLGPLNDIVANLDIAGDLFSSMTKADSPDALAQSIVKSLSNAKSSNGQKIQKAINYVCNGLADIEMSA